VARFERGERGRIAGVVDVGHVAAAGTAEVGVRARRRFVHRGPLARDIQFQDQAEFVQPGQSAVDRGETDARAPLAGALINVDRRSVATGAVCFDDVQHQAVICGHLGA